MTVILQPPHFTADMFNDELEVVFLAGPIQGAPDWQAQAIKLIGEWDNLAIANPRTPDPFHGDYEIQVRWEWHHLGLAALQGRILFWLACQDPSEDHDPDRAYAQTSRIELGEWIGRSLDEGISFVLGIEPGFSGERYIRQRLGAMYATMPIPNTLEDTVELLGKEMVWYR